MLEAEARDSPSNESANLSEETKMHLQEMVKLLNTGIGELVLDAKLIRSHLEALQGHLSESVEEALLPAAHLEIHRFTISRAQRRLADRETQNKLANEKSKYLEEAANIEERIGTLNRSQATLEKAKTDLIERRKILVQELAQVDQDLADVEDRLREIPPSISTHKKNQESLVQQANQLEKIIKPIPGSDADDRREIDTVDSIRLRAIETIQNLLGSV